MNFKPKTGAPDGKVMVGRLALRVEGDMWKAYYAHPDTMEIAVPIGSIAMMAVEDNEARREAWKTMMWEIVADSIEGLTGTRPTRIDRLAPVHEIGVKP